MKKYYTRVCNFYYGKKSAKLIKQKKTLPLKGNKEISFDQIEIITRKSKKIINIKDVKKLIRNGTISEGMIPKVETCINAVESGVKAAVILDGTFPHAILLEIFTEHGVGTLITK